MKSTTFDIARRSLRTLWAHKYLWIIGFFAAAGSGSGGAQGSTDGGAAMAGGPPPAWLWPVLIAGAVIALAVGVAHIIAEGGLIDAVDRDESGREHSLRTALVSGLGSFWRVLGVKAAIAGLLLVSLAAASVPAILTAAGALPIWLGVVLSIPLVIVAVPWLLTLYFLRQYALRFVVIEDLGVRAGLQAARRFLHGRIALSVKLMVADGLGRAAVSLAGGAAILLTAGLLGGFTYLLGGVVPALVAGGLVAVPLVLAMSGITGAYGSSLWTLGYIEERGG